MLLLMYSVNGKKGKTVTPSRKLQAKDEISTWSAGMTAVSPRLPYETSLVIRSEERQLYTLAKGETQL